MPKNKQDCLLSWNEMKEQRDAALADKEAISRQWSEDATNYLRDLRLLTAEVTRLTAIANAGHYSDCGGMDMEKGECDCGWLQREGAAEHIESLRSKLAAAEGLLQEAFEEQEEDG